MRNAKFHTIVYGETVPEIGSQFDKTDCLIIVQKEQGGTDVDILYADGNGKVVKHNLRDNFVIGRNLLLNSDISSNSSKFFNFSFADNLQILRNQEIVLSINIDVEGATSGRIGLELAINYEDGSKQWINIWESTRGDAKKRIWRGNKFQDKPIASITGGAYNQLQAINAKWSNPALYLVNNYLWTPAPEDVQKAIDEKLSNEIETFNEKINDTDFQNCKLQFYSLKKLTDSRLILIESVGRSSLSPEDYRSIEAIRRKLKDMGNSLEEFIINTNNRKKDDNFFNKFYLDYRLYYNEVGEFNYKFDEIVIRNIRK